MGEKIKKLHKKRIQLYNLYRNMFFNKKPMELSRKTRTTPQKWLICEKPKLRRGYHGMGLLTESSIIPNGLNKLQMDGTY